MILSNELLFFAHVIVVSVSVLVALAHSYGALLAVLGTQLVLANFFVTKQIIFFGMNTTCSEVFIVSGMYGVSLVQAYYGTKRARQTILYTFLILLLFVVLSQLHLLYAPLEGGSVGDALSILLAPAPRMMFASMVSYLLSERIHVWFSRRMHVRGIAPLLRICAIALGQTVDTVSFVFIGLYGMISQVGSVILVGLTVKLLVILALSPLLSLTQWFMPLGSKEGV